MLMLCSCVQVCCKQGAVHAQDSCGQAYIRFVLATHSAFNVQPLLLSSLVSFQQGGCCTLIKSVASACCLFASNPEDACIQTVQDSVLSCFVCLCKRVCCHSCKAGFLAPSVCASVCAHTVARQRALLTCLSVQACVLSQLQSSSSLCCLSVQACVAGMFELQDNIAFENHLLIALSVCAGVCSRHV